MTQLPLALRLRDHARFDTFVPGGNIELVAHLLDAAQGKREGAAWLWGSPGGGKTHLLQAACAAADAAGRRAMYLSLADAKRIGPALLHGLDNVELVALDDVEHAAGKADWEQALFRLFDLPPGSKRALLVAARVAPAAVALGLPDLASRAAAAMVYRVAALDDSDRLEALQRHAAQRGLAIEDAAARYLLRRLPRDLNVLCAWLDKLDRASLAAHRKLTVPFVRAALAGEGEGEP